MEKTGSLTRRVNIILIVSLFLGIGIAIANIAVAGIVNLQTTTEKNLSLQADILHQSIKNAMLPGQSRVAVDLFSDLRGVNPGNQFFLFRSDGVEAFSDNTTIAKVNSLGHNFPLKDTPAMTPMIATFDESFQLANSTGQEITTSEIIQGKSIRTIYNPLLNLPKCTICHGSSHTVRGVLKISVDITDTMRRQLFTVVIAALAFLIVVVVLTLVLTKFLHSHVIDPVKHIGDVCADVTGGNFSVKVDVKNKDEIGSLGDTVNDMVKGLRERFELSKYVSSSTIASLENAERGASQPMTLFFSDVRGFTAYSENRSPENVVESLNRVLNVQTEIIHRNGGDVDKYVGDEVVALFSGEDQAENACRSAVEIQKELESRSEAEYSGLHVGIGINSGEIILGMIGSERRADFTAIGDHVNFASRLCSIAKPGVVIISDTTFQAVAQSAIVSSPYKVKVKGKQDYQKVYYLEGIGNESI